MPSGSLQQLQLSCSQDTAALSRMIGLHGTDVIVAAASSALKALAQQKRLSQMKKRTEDKARLKKITDQSREKICELHSAAQKVLSILLLGRTI
jgi:hypothetical protein